MAKNGRRDSGQRIIAPAVMLVVLLAAAGYLCLRGGGGKPQTVSGPAATVADPSAPALSLAALSTESEVTAEAAAESAPAEKADELVEEVKAPAPSASDTIKLDSQLWLEGVKAYWAKEDAVLASAAKYEDVRDGMRAKAGEMLKGIDAADAKAVVALAQGEIDAFYDMGSLIEPASYEHGYLARAIMELAAEREPENFELLTELKEAIGTTLPFQMADFKPNDAAIEALWPVADKQKELVLSGRVPPSPEAMLAVYDWCEIVRRKTRQTTEEVPGWQWLVDNADAGGWPKMKHLFVKAVGRSKEGVSWGTNLYVYSIGADMEAYTRTVRVNWRGFPSRRGSKEYREKVSKVWEDRKTLSRGE